jgi:long-chain acyl-CoA synthetase
LPKTGTGKIRRSVLQAEAEGKPLPVDEEPA